LDDYITTFDCGGGIGDEEPKTFAKVVEGPRWMKLFMKKWILYRKMGHGYCWTYL
jgi:hypothetical protein